MTSSLQITICNKIFIISAETSCIGKEVNLKGKKIKFRLNRKVPMWIGLLLIDFLSFEANIILQLEIWYVEMIFPLIYNNEKALKLNWRNWIYEKYNNWKNWIITANWFYRNYSASIFAFQSAIIFEGRKRTAEKYIWLKSCEKFFSRFLLELIATVGQ